MEQKINKDSFGQETYVRFAVREDIPRIMQFIHDEWAQDHILAHDREIFEFQYVYGEEVCFVLSLNKRTEAIEGVLGYIPYAAEGERDIFTALWKVRKSRNLFQGMDQLYFLEEHGRCRNLYCAGINARTFSIYKYMKKQVASLRHFYMLGEGTDYRIARIRKRIVVQPKRPDTEVTFRRLEDFAELETLYDGLQKSMPQKSLAYLHRRYFCHPEYRYILYHIRQAGQDGVLIGREQAYGGAVIYRIMDFLGEEACFAAAGMALQELIRQNHYEYVDIYEYGMQDETMLAAGFVPVQKEDENIIPNYFEPFVQENIDIHIFLPGGVKGRMFKGDGDQDRPNFRKAGQEKRNGTAGTDFLSET